MNQMGSSAVAAPPRFGVASTRDGGATPGYVGSWDGDSLLEPLSTNGFEDSPLIVVCAEPGMGKTHFAQKLSRKLASRGMQSKTYTLEEDDAETSCSKIVRDCRDCAHRAERDGAFLVVIDGVAAPDERQVAKESRAIEKLVASGCHVIICLRPESEQLLEALHPTVCLRVDDLLFRMTDEDGLAWQLSGGVGKLVSALRTDVLMGERYPDKGPRYLTAVESLYGSLVRRTLSDEEFRIRLAIILLGSGSVDDVALVAGRCDEEQLSWLSRDVVLFGIDRHARTFCCRGISRNVIYRRCVGSFQALAASEPQLVMRACSLLAIRGDVERSAITSSLCSSEEDLATTAVSWGVKYVLAGEGYLALEGVRSAKSLGLPRGAKLVLTESAVALESGPAADLPSIGTRLDGLLACDSTEAVLMQKVRQVAVCREVRIQPCGTHALPAVKADDEDGIACLDHVRVSEILATGSFGDAYALMSNEMQVGQAQSLPTACLCDDLRLALFLSGGVPDARERLLFESADRFYARDRLGAAQSYHAAIASIPKILMGTEHGTADLEDAAVRAERQGDSFLDALFLAVMAVADIRARALSRAHVRASRAASLARAVGVAYLESSADLVDALSLELLGETGSLQAYASKREGGSGPVLLGRMAAHVVGGDPGQKIDPLVPLGAPCPKDALWALELLLYDCPHFSEAMMGLVPPAWLELVRAMRLRQMEAIGSDILGRPATEPPSHTRPMSLRRGIQTSIEIAPPQPASVHVTLMGGFGVLIEGRPVPKRVFERRRARDLISLLSIVPGHRMRRYQIVEIIWPKTDYHRAPRKLYESTGEARRLLSSAKVKGSPIVSDRAQGTVSLDASLVSIDVDEFELEARKTLSEDGDDFWVLDHASRMVRLYATGPDDRLSLLGEPIVTRLEDLKTLYVDGLVAAGEAALRLGKNKLAVRYAMDAHRMRDLREDAMVLLVQALRAAGRGFEVAGLYRAYARHLMEVEGASPSMALRRAVELASGEGTAAF